MLANRFFAIIVILILLSNSISILNAQEGVIVTTSDNASLRSGPGSDFGALAVVPYNTSMTAVGRNDDSSWIQVNYNETTGWIATFLLNWAGNLDSLPVGGVQAAPAPETSAGSEAPAGGVTAVNPNVMNVRSASSSNSTQVGQLPAGSTIAITGRVGSGNNLWVRINFQGQEAWVAGWLLNISGDVDSVQDLSAQSVPAGPPGRSTEDRPDDVSGNQIHVMYVIPSDGGDENLDTNGVLATSVTAFNNWLAGQTGGPRLRLDTYEGSLDITFWRLRRSDTDIAASGAFVRDRIESELRNAGFNSRRKIYAVYYGGRSTYSCGGGAWPPTLRGSVAALYLRGEPPGFPPCATNPFTSSPDALGYLEFSMLHEILHTIGVVATCAPHHILAGHVSDDPRDLMYAGDQSWQPSILDINRDDYFGHSNGRCLDLADSQFLVS